MIMMRLHAQRDVSFDSDHDRSAWILKCAQYMKGTRPQGNCAMLSDPFVLSC